MIEMYSWERAQRQIKFHQKTVKTGRIKKEE
jgi:hypothetical protein